MEDITEKIKKFVETIKNSINCQCPAQISKVNEDGTVDVIVFRNDEIENQLIPSVKIKYPESGRAFIQLGVAEGDYGVVRYFDTNIQDYLDGQDGYNYDSRTHNTNDACFELGFIPNPSSFIYPSGSNITIGNKDGSALLTVDANGIINIIGATVNIAGNSAINIEGGSVTIGSSTTIDGKVFLEHQHSNGNQGANTGGVI